MRKFAHAQHIHVHMQMSLKIMYYTSVKILLLVDGRIKFCNLMCLLIRKNFFRRFWIRETGRRSDNC